MGTPDFAVPALDALYQAGHEIALLLCQPDKKKGRGQKVQFPPTKEYAVEKGIEVFQPTKIRTSEVLERLQSVKADFFIVIAYGKILPKSVLKLPTKACINVHASLLPQWRGAAPIQFSLLNGDSETGVCSMLMDVGMDTGDLLLTEKISIAPDETAESLHPRLSKMGAEIIVKTIEEFDQIMSTPQNHELATYARLLTKMDCMIDWTQELKKIYNQFRAFAPAPSVFSTFRGKRLRIHNCKALTKLASGSAIPGNIHQVHDEGFDVVTGGRGLLRVLKAQPESKKAMLAKDLVNGYQIKIGETLGEIKD